jgi:hypothetical protein
MERTLELMDKSAKEGDPISSSDGGGGSNGEASVYSSHFIMDFLPPTKKGQRECLPLIVKVHINTKITNTFECLLLFFLLNTVEWRLRL